MCRPPPVLVSLCLSPLFLCPVWVVAFTSRQFRLCLDHLKISVKRAINLLIVYTSVNWINEEGYCLGLIRGRGPLRGGVLDAACKFDSGPPPRERFLRWPPKPPLLVCSSMPCVILQRSQSKQDKLKFVWSRGTWAALKFYPPYYGVPGSTAEVPSQFTICKRNHLQDRLSWIIQLIINATP